MGKTGWPLFIIGLIFGAGAGFTFAAGQGITLDGHDHDDPAHHGALGAGQHAHEEALELSPDGALPEIALSVTPDPVSGWNLHLETTDFAFAPDQAGHAHVPGQGHAHVYLDGVKIARLYGPWMHLSDLPEAGMVEITVTLSSNDHRVLTVGGAPISATISVPGDAP